MLHKGVHIVKIPKYNVYLRGPALIICKCFGKKTSDGTVENEDISNKELPQELNKPIIKIFKKRKIQSTLTDNIWGADLTDMQLISKVNKGICFDYVLLIFSVNNNGLFLWNTKKVLQLTILFKKFYLIKKKTKYR